MGSAAGFLAGAAGRLAGRGVAKCAGGGVAATGTSLAVMALADKMPEDARRSAEYLAVPVFFGAIGGLMTVGVAAGGLVGWGARSAAVAARRAARNGVGG